MVKKMDKMQPKLEPVPDATDLLVQVLALGAIEIEQGKFRSAEDVFAELDKEDGQPND
jgi:hypothetical protein